MTIPYGQDKEVFSTSLFVVLCNRLTSCLLAAVILLVPPSGVYGVPCLPPLAFFRCCAPARSKARA